MLTLNSTRKLNDGKEIPVIGFGTWLLNKEPLIDCLKIAAKNKYKLIDTAQFYNNEYDIGNFIYQTKINKLYITSKVWPSNYQFHTMASIKQTLKRLNIKSIDLMLLHWPFPDFFDNTVIAYKELIKARKKKLVKSIGVSNFQIEDLKRLHKAVGEWPAVNQILFSPANQQKKLIKFCHTKNIVVEGYSLIKPLFDGVPIAGQLSSDEKDTLKKIGKKYKKSSIQIILRWALQREVVIFPKSKSEHRIKENIDIFDFKLSQEEMTVINKMDKDNSDEYIKNSTKQIKLAMNIFGHNFKHGLLYDHYSKRLKLMNKVMNLRLKFNTRKNKKNP